MGAWAWHEQRDGHDVSSLAKGYAGRECINTGIGVSMGAGMLVFIYLSFHSHTKTDQCSNFCWPATLDQAALSQAALTGNDGDQNDVDNSDPELEGWVHSTL